MSLPARSRRPAPGRLSCRSAGRTHRGCVRPLNEDAFLEAPSLGLWAVADGMGGHQAGDVASRAVAEALGGLAPAGSAYAFVRDVEAALQRVNRDLIAFAAERGADVVGSTVVALLAHEGHFACLWAGDSRGYLLRDGALSALTRDHSLVQELLDSGALTAAEARRNGRRNVITRAVGVDADLALEMRQGALAAGDVFLLCSDGLTGVLAEEELIETIGRTDDLAVAADALVESALRRGAPDNVTVVLVRAEAA